MIKPTVGRIVHYKMAKWNNPVGICICLDPEVPCAAIITYVWGDEMVNLTVFDHSGKTFPATSVALRQDRPAMAGECEWMEIPEVAGAQD